MHLTLPIVLALAAVGAVAGCLGAMVGVGGGVLLVPALAIGFGVDLKIAIATSLVAVLATSTAAGSVYVGKGVANMRLAMTLETTTTVGGILGGIIAVYVSPEALAYVFASMMLLTAGLMLRAKRDAKRGAPKPVHARERAEHPSATKSRTRSPAATTTSSRARWSTTRRRASRSAWQSRSWPAPSRGCSASAAASSRCRR